ncbi:MAG TPA: DUF1294 domain-containing protein [Telluria sp.]
MLNFLPIYAFVALYASIAFGRGVPHLVGIAYLVASAFCFAAYAADKSAARANERRTPESTLLMLGLACGWPGGLLAQQWLRHKTVKQPFRTQFWVTVVINVAAFTYLAGVMR